MTSEQYKKISRYVVAGVFLAIVLFFFVTFQYEGNSQLPTLLMGLLFMAQPIALGYALYANLRGKGWSSPLSTARFNVPLLFSLIPFVGIIFVALFMALTPDRNSPKLARNKLIFVAIAVALAFFLAYSMVEGIYSFRIASARANFTTANRELDYVRQIKIKSGEDKKDCRAAFEEASLSLSRASNAARGFKNAPWAFRIIIERNAKLVRDSEIAAAEAELNKTKAALREICALEK